ncbi:uncharacterized protein [Spinacia oleracea]|uniref:Integrase catalytic domain-containing protein n=1 Tax=Spinacia oleracea TaxID=3562 RepID=A0ABM3R266_SPIOL|nr:uncharacterized protein LOC130464267 [Spinacia oleracea]
MKLNPKKCVFGVKSGKFLGFMVSERGIDANPDKVQAALDLPEPKTKRDVQRLTGRLAALSRFISKASDKGAPFFKALKPKTLPGGEAEPIKKKGVPRKVDPELTWGQEQRDAFQQLRAYLAQLPTLARPKEGETLYLYVAISPGTVSAVLLREEEKKQQPIYFTSRTLTDAETRYPLIEKVAYVVVVAAQKLRPYFDSHQILVLTDQPLEKVLDKIERSGRLAAWAFELSEFGIKYQPRTAIKAQALADFLAECSYQEVLDDTKRTWEVYTDGSSTVNGSGAGVVLIPPVGKSIEALTHKALRAGFWWPTMVSEAKALTRKCEKCQKFAPAIHQPAQTLQATLYPLPFAQWGLDIIGPFPSAVNQKKWLIVGVDYFSKWIQAEAVSSITEQQVCKFIWQNIITRFGIPRLLVFDHGKQFDNTPLQRWCKQFGIHLVYSAVCHPQSNGQAEAANKLILNALKKRVEDEKSKWLEQLPGTLWSLRTTEKEATGQTPFHLVYGSEAVIPVEIGT